MTPTAIAPLLALLAGGPMVLWQGPGTGPPPGVPPEYAFLYDSGMGKNETWEKARHTIPYQSISLLRGGCFGTCPVYSVTLNADGKATYTGKANAPRQGSYAASVYFGDFARLAMFIDQSGFMKLADRYAAPWTDDETVVVSVVLRDGTTKTVSDYGRFGPPDLWILEHAIDGIVDRMKWTPSPADH